MQAFATFRAFFCVTSALTRLHLLLLGAAAAAAASLLLGAAAAGGNFFLSIPLL